MKDINRRILNIALPAIVSNITVPLLGLVDVAIVGHLGSAAYIGAIAVGGMVFNVMYWLFSFLRMGTGGMTSQAYGQRNLNEVARILVRSLAVAAAVAVALIVLQMPIHQAALDIMSPTADVRRYAETYIGILIWGAPAMLGLYSFTGWFIGMQNSRLPMIIAITQNVVNIAASLVFVYLMGMKVEGVALGTLVAQYAGLLMAVIAWATTYSRLCRHFSRSGLFGRRAMEKFFSVNRDIFLRTLFMVAVNFYFLSAGASQGAVVLAVNTLLMQLFTLFSYVMDGFAYAGEALCGRLYGAGNSEGFARMVRRLFMWGLGLSVVYTLVYALGGRPFLMLLTDNAGVIDASASYVPWAVFIPLCGMAAFIWDGVFIGITATRGMLLSSAIASVLFFVVYLVLRPMLHNHALWIAFLTYLAMRGVVQTVLYNKWSRGKGPANKDR